MTAKSSRLLPFIVLGIVIATLTIELIFDVEIDLESYLPLLIAIGIGGAAKSAITRAAQAKTESDKLKLTESIKDLLDKEKRN